MDRDRYTDATYGDRWAMIYDSWRRPPGFDTDAGSAVSFLLELGGPALELGIGTGRVALPLAEMGVEVHGLDVSEPMVAELRSKPGGADIPVSMTSMADFDLGRQHLQPAFGARDLLLRRTQALRAGRADQPSDETLRLG